MNASGNSAVHYSATFADTDLGKEPVGWRDVIAENINPSWGVDGKGFLRPLHKSRLSGWWGAEQEGDKWTWPMLPYEGLLIYEGSLSDGGNSDSIADGELELVFKKVPEADIHVTLIGRAQGEDTYYGVRFSGANQLELIKIVEGKFTQMNEFVTRERYQEGEEWKLTLTMLGNHITGEIFDENNTIQARVDVLDADLKSGFTGLRATTYAAVRSFKLVADNSPGKKGAPSTRRMAQTEMKSASSAEVYDYPVIRPVEDVEGMNTSFEDIAGDYDVVVFGAGTGGWAAAVQAARMGVRVLLVEESDWMGGQMAAAGVTSMDEAGVWYQFPVRERGIYREFHESMVNYYYKLDKDPFRAYHSVPEQHEGGYEPKVARAVMYGFIKHERRRLQEAGSSGVLHIVTGTHAAKVEKGADKITGVVLESTGNGKKRSKTVECHVVVDATEHGDIIPLTGAAYRVGTTRSDNPDHNAPVQDFTYLAVIREYPEGIPEHLRIKEKPPEYEKYSKRFHMYQLWGDNGWQMPGIEISKPLSWRRIMTWRGMADSDSAMTGRASEGRHTQAGLNTTAQDYPVRVATIEDPATRLADERDGIHHTLAVIYYIQHELGLPWSVAEDEGYDTPYNRRMMKQRKVRPDLMSVAVNLPQWPYVRESRRIEGIYTLRARDLSRLDNAKHFPTSLAMGDYYMDLHRTEEHLEADLDQPGYDRGEGPFQVPFEAFIPKQVDGFVAAEKNISQSRLVSGATRLQPITMLTGQAAGAISATAVLKGVQPREINPLEVQWALLENGSTLVARWYGDIPWGTPLWRATQLLSLHGVMDRPGPLKRENGGPLRGAYQWGVEDHLTSDELNKAVIRLAEMCGVQNRSGKFNTEGDKVSWKQLCDVLKSINPAWCDGVKNRSGSVAVTCAEFAELAAGILLRHGTVALLRD